MARPTSLIATKGIELLTLGTPNGFKASIILEELKDAYGLQYTYQTIDISKNIQKEPWFIAVNPNGRIPAIVDHDNGGLNVFEGNAILGYLTRRYDTENRFSFAVDDDDYTRAESWIGWQHGGVGPMQGQANHFVRYAKEKIPYGMFRYVGETERLYGILDAQLKDRDFIVGPGRGKFSIADIALLGWARVLPAVGLTMDQWPSLAAWYARCLARPAVQRGFKIPSEPQMSPVEPLSADNLEYKKAVDAAKEKYDYKYTSP
ncbi:glutathione S-transferase [Stachybotrys elegans]|uniref:Glutathione S-transferase n=1 Tax=Stachybotrys elegans TaxID=80388 RepID=A0A8K0SLW5_9HYPO|nr:glutathione S-transferase [Stachybotrys elegans]